MAPPASEHETQLRLSLIPSGLRGPVGSYRVTAAWRCRFLTTTLLFGTRLFALSLSVKQTCPALCEIGPAPTGETRVESLERKRLWGVTSGQLAHAKFDRAQRPLLIAWQANWQ